MNKRKTLENMWVNKKVLEKRKEKAFMKEAKKFQLKTTLHLPTLLRLYLRPLRSAKPHK